MKGDIDRTCVKQRNQTQTKDESQAEEAGWPYMEGRYGREREREYCKQSSDETQLLQFGGQQCVQCEH